MSDFEAQLLNMNVILIAAAAWFILWVLRRIWPGMNKIRWVKKLKPAYPALLCQGFVWIPGTMPMEDPTVGMRILIGLWCGFLASIGYQLIRRILSRQDVNLPEDPNQLMPTVSMVPPAQDSEMDATEENETPNETPVPAELRKPSSETDEG